MDNLVKIERDLFIQSAKIDSLKLSLSREEDYYIGLRDAFDDAFNQYARREKKHYAADKDDFMEPVVKQLYKYFTTDSTDFDKCFKKCIELSKNILNNNRHGIAQKFVNMSFKYLYCYGDVSKYEHKFTECHLPLDKYTIKWVKSLKVKEINSELKNIDDAWSNLDEKLYENIQKTVIDKLNSGVDYRISYNPNANNNGIYKLPKNRLETEFIVWHQEKLNELHKVLSNTTLEDFERLGISKIF